MHAWPIKVILCQWPANNLPFVGARKVYIAHQVCKLVNIAKRETDRERERERGHKTQIEKISNV